MSDVAVPEWTGEIVHPATGEILSLAEPSQVAVALQEMRELRDRLRYAESILSQRLTEEASKRGESKLFLPGGVSFEVTRRKEIQWDMEELENLRDLGLPEDRWGQLVRTTVEEKVNANEAKKIAAANPEYAEVISKARTDYLGEPYVGKIERQR